MRLGICTEYFNVRQVEQCGFDYIELPLFTVALLEKEQFAELRAEFAAGTIRSEACNLFFPPGLRLTGPDVDKRAIREYVRIALDRAVQLGLKLAVVGCGPQRHAPEGWLLADAIKQFGEALCMVGDEAEQYHGVTVTVEPIYSEHTNIIHTVREGLALVRELGHPCVRLIGDYYHMRWERESMSALAEAGDALAHMHICNTVNRRCPLNSTEDRYDEMFAELRRIGYRGALSIEAASFVQADAERSVPFLREKIAEYGLA